MAGRSPSNGDGRAEDSVEGSGAGRGSGRGGPGACAASDARRLDERADRASLRGARGYGSALAQRFRPGRGVVALRARIAPGPVPVKALAALRVAAPLLSAPVEDRRNWTLSRLADEIARCEGLRISRSQLSKVLRKKGGSVSGGPGTR